MKILITGGGGQLAEAFSKYLGEIKTYDFKVFSRKEMDITNYQKSLKCIKEFSPNIIINTAAYTKVDDAESNKKEVFNVNKNGVFNIAKICNDFDIPLIHFSTDYVFDGKNKNPYSEEDATNPINLYGLSKLEGENSIKEITKKYLIVRISWVFSESGNNFLSSILKLADSRDSINVVSDQIGNPTSTDQVSKIIIDILPKINDNWGVYHLVQYPSTSWSEFARKIIDMAYSEGLINKKVLIKNINSSEYLTKAKRPFNSRMFSNKIQNTFNIKLDSWDSSLHKIIKNKKNEL